MCGIFFSLGWHDNIAPCATILDQLKRRGPDSLEYIQRRMNIPATGDASDHDKHTTFVTCISTVLSLRGDKLVKQPLEDDLSDSLLCWNGEAWMINDESLQGNDAEQIFRMLLAATSQCTAEGDHERLLQPMCNAISSISGPYAFVFYDARNRRVFYGRDALGRRSLLIKRDIHDGFQISSVSDGSLSEAWMEVEADGIYTINLTDDRHAQHYKARTNSGNEQKPFEITHISWSARNDISRHSLYLASPFPRLNKQMIAMQTPVLNLESFAVARLEMELRHSLLLRVRHIPLPPTTTKGPARIAILFSGGLDCTVLARLIHDLLPLSYEIDLLNAAFENPRVVKAAEKFNQINAVDSVHMSPYSVCPDRITGLSSCAELYRVCPGRTWRFIYVDIAYAETMAHRQQVISLIYPHKTEMDLSIAYALYFAARGRGTMREGNTDITVPYVTPSRVLLSGLGADELFAGYHRHAAAFNRGGHRGLSDELELDFDRLGERNLGRDDRVISHWGREVRYPYLDEKVVSWTLELPIWSKCGFGQKEINCETPVLEPGKSILRLLAWKLGMRGAAVERKRAIQFGARTAKMQIGSMTGTQILY